MNVLVTGINGQTEILTGHTRRRRKRRVNGDHTFNFAVYQINNNEHSFPLVEAQALIHIGDDIYRVKSVVRKGQWKDVRTIHKFFDDLLGKWQYNVLNGYTNFVQALNHIFAGTGWTWVNQAATGATTFENFGDDTALSLLQTVLNRYGVEYQIDSKNKQVIFRNRIGTDTDSQFRWHHNIKAYEFEENTQNMTVNIKGFGKDGLQVSYRSPAADYYGIEDTAKPIRDERYTTQESLLSACRAAIQDTPELRLKTEIVRLYENGLDLHPYEVGDSVYAVIEEINLLAQIRIIEMEDDPLDTSFSPIVDLSNFKRRKGFVSQVAQFQQVQRRVNDILDEDGNINLTMKKLYANTNVYTDNTGIWMIDPDNPNRYAHHGSGGSDYHLGGIRIERADGYATMIDGVLQREFAIIGASPPFTHADVTVENEFLKTSTTIKRHCDFYTFKHQARYLKVKLAMYATGSGGVTMYVDDVNNNVLASYTSYEQSSSADIAVYGVDLVVDIGPPTGLIKSVYLRMKAGNTSTIARGRMVHIRQDD